MIKGQKLLTTEGVEVALFPMKYLKVTQATNSNETHKGTLNIDLAGKDGGIEDVFASVSLSVVQNVNSGNHEIIYWSDKKVLWANGVIDYISIRTLHDDVVNDLPVGKRFKQGEVCGQEGNTGQSSGNHVHLCVARGHTKRLVVNSSGYRDLYGSVLPSEVFHVNDTIILKDGGMNWKTYVAPVIVVEPPKPVVPPTPVEQPLKVGDKVYIKRTATKYSTGQTISTHYKKGGIYAYVPYTIIQDGETSARKSNKDYFLLSRIKSWVKKTDIERA